MVNNKGQSIVIFVLVLPLLILFISYVFDVSNVQYERNKLNSIASVVKDSKSDNKCDIAVKNDKDLICTSDGNKITLKKRIKSIFGKILNKDYYDISVTIELGEM